MRIDAMTTSQHKLESALLAGEGVFKVCCATHPSQDS
jgi:hypothetical protein